MIIAQVPDSFGLTERSGTVLLNTSLTKRSLALNSLQWIARLSPENCPGGFCPTDPTDPTDLTDKPFPGRSKVNPEPDKLGGWYWESGFEGDIACKSAILTMAGMDHPWHQRMIGSLAGSRFPSMVAAILCMAGGGIICKASETKLSHHDATVARLVADLASPDAELRTSASTRWISPPAS